MSQDNRILLRMCKMSGHEMKFITEAFADEWVVPLGPNVNGFEADLKSFTGTPGSVVALASGTAAIHLALIACGVQPGDEVMVQSFTFAATANPVAYLGAHPVFVDSEGETWNMDPQLLDRAIEERIRVTGKKPKAILPCYLYGMPAKIREILEIGKKWDIPVIEDAAEAFGSRYAGKCCGTSGRFGVLSFNGNKMITTSGGGALICRNPEEASHILFLATQAREGFAYYQHEEIGYNYRLSNISAGIGRGQMMVAEDYIAHHRHRHRYYTEAFEDVPGITVHDNPTDEFDSNFWLTTALLSPDTRIKGEERAYARPITGAVGGTAGVTHADKNIHTDCEPATNVEALRLILTEAKIESRPLWKPMHRQPVFKDATAYINGVSESIFRQGICLPSGPWVTDTDADRVIKTIKEAILD